jgi:hypothetical protein
VRRIRVTLKASGVSGVAVLMDDRAPKTCDAVWSDLPIEGPVFHAKWANNEIYTIREPLAVEPGRENPTMMPIPGDLCYFYITPGDFVPPASNARHRETGSIDLALFYGRENYLMGPMGPMPGNLFATLESGLPELAAACLRLWREGTVGEQLVLERLEGGS